MKEMYKKAKVILIKLRKEVKKYVDRNRKETVESKVRDRVLLSMKNLMWQIINRKTKKLIEKFVKPYKYQRMWWS